MLRNQNNGKHFNKLVNNLLLQSNCDLEELFVCFFSIIMACTNMHSNGLILTFYSFILCVINPIIFGIMYNSVKCIKISSKIVLAQIHILISCLFSLFGHMLAILLWAQKQPPCHIFFLKGHYIIIYTL